MNHSDNKAKQTDTHAQDGNILTGLFTDMSTTQLAYEKLLEKGYKKEDIHLGMSEETRQRDLKNYEDTDFGTMAAEGAGTSTAIGSTLGVIIGAITAIGTSIAIPGVGVVAGPIASAILGAGAGGFTGGLVGGLIGFGIPEEHAKVYETGIKQGHYFLGVHPKNADDAKKIEQHWKENNGLSVYSDDHFVPM